MTAAASREAATAPPVARRLAYAKHLRNGAAEVWIARVDGTRKRRLANGYAPSVSPDGRWVAFVRERDGKYVGGEADLWIVRANGEGARLLVRGVDRGATWSPDSRRLAVSQPLSQADQDYALLSVDVRTGRARTVARGLIRGWSFSPSSDQIAFGRAKWSGRSVGQINVDVFVAAADGGNARRMTTDGDSAWPVWGPRFIAYARLVPHGGWAANEVWLVRPDGSGRRLLARPPRKWLGQGFYGLEPALWSRDGRTLIAELGNEFGGPPYAIDVRSGRAREVGAFSFRGSPHGISRDGRTLLVYDSGVEYTERSIVGTVRIDSRALPRVIARYASQPSWN
jgi:WD40-like Beta Propeller Repeat